MFQECKYVLFLLYQEFQGIHSKINIFYSIKWYLHYFFFVKFSFVYFISFKNSISSSWDLELCLYVSKCILTLKRWGQLISLGVNEKKVGVEHLIALLTPQCFQILLTPRMFPVWNFVVGIFARKALHNMGRVLSTLSCKYLYK